MKRRNPLPAPLNPTWPCVAFLGFLFLVAGCALFGSPDRIERARDYKTTAPSSWKSCPKEEADSCHILPSKNVVTVTTSCRDSEIEDPNLLTRQLLMGMRQVQVASRDRFVIQGHEGLRTRLEGLLDKKRVHLEVFTFASKGCVYDFSLISSTPIPKGDSESFETFFKSFHYGNH